MECKCCEKDESGEYILEPCCNLGEGICEANNINHCIHCGGLMFEEGESWWHHSQEEIPIQERGKIHRRVR